MTVHLYTELKAIQERCAEIADAHKGSAAKKRRARGYPSRLMSEDVATEIESEERGEDIAAEMIAKAIRKLRI